MIFNGLKFNEDSKFRKKSFTKIQCVHNKFISSCTFYPQKDFLKRNGGVMD